MDQDRPDSVVLADTAAGWKCAYVHVPFCRRRCPYCDFAIVDESGTTAIDYKSYADAVVAEIRMESEFASLDAVNIGGGTPSRMPPPLLGRIIDALGDAFGINTDAEISIEVNPEDWSEVLGAGLDAIGITRVSLGAQSFDATVLGSLGRLHTPDMVAAAVAGARSAGMRSVGIDLIFGHPDEDDVSWTATVDTALGLDVDHISTYALTVEHGTSLSRSVRDGGPAPDDDAQADRYAHFLAASSAHGFVRYEVSNHAQPGHVCTYNLATWAHGEYVAFGLGAHDHRWGVRSRNHPRLDRYLDAIERGERPRIGTETLTDTEQERDRIMVGLRLATGVPLVAGARAFAASRSGARLVDAGILQAASGRLVVVDPMMTDMVLREFLAAVDLDASRAAASSALETDATGGA